jgi:hypothetical protein
MARKENKDRISATSVKSDWLSKLAAEITAPEAPEGWYTIPQIAEHLNVAHSTASKMMERKGAEKKKFSYVASDGKRLISWHYKL